MSEFTELLLDIRRVEARPVQVEAVLVTTENLEQVADWINGNGHAARLGEGQLIIQTFEGPFVVRPGDRVLRGIRGEFTRCDPDLYADSYTDLGPLL